MARPTNSIDKYQFLALKGQIEMPHKQVDIQQRRGVDGTEITVTGTRAIPFSLVSFRDEVDIDTAQTILIVMRQLIGQDPVVLIQDDFDVSVFNQVAVLDVRLLSLTAITESVGGFLGAPKAFMVLEWTLIGV
jgi:hypothetical protein